MYKNFLLLLKTKLKKLFLLRATPELIARGAAVGIFIGIFPTFGFGALFIAALVPFFKFNVPAAIAGTLAGGPFFAPVWITLSCLIVGIDIKSIKAPEDTIVNIIGHYSQVLGLYLAGNAIVSTTVALLSYFLVKALIALNDWRKNRKQQSNQTGQQKPSE